MVDTHYILVRKEGKKMSYSDFTLSSVKKQFNLNLREKYGLFEEIKSLQPQQLLTEILRDNIPLALASNTEKSRSEMIITPVLIEIRKQLERKITIFSGVSFNVDNAQGLNGNCDFLITQSTDLLIIESPVITLVEAKKEDLNSGLGQCVAEMIAAQIFNQNNNVNNINNIYGVVTSGTNWKFLQLNGQNVFIDLKEYYIENIAQILGILAHCFTFSEED